MRPIKPALLRCEIVSRSISKEDEFEVRIPLVSRIQTVWVKAEDLVDPSDESVRPSVVELMQGELEEKTES